MARIGERLAELRALNDAAAAVVAAGPAETPAAKPD